MNTMRRSMVAGLVISSSLFVAVPAYANTIDGLYNTGVDNLGNALANSTVGDLHYSLIASPQESITTTKIGTAVGGWPIGPWLGDSAQSAWIGPNTAVFEGPVGDYVYRTTFSLNQVNPNTASILGRWSTDNLGIEIYLNGVRTGHFTNGDFGTWTSFALSSGFVSGVNTIDFKLNNGGGPTGLRVEFLSSSVAPVPEPDVYAMLVAGIGLLGAVARKRR